VKADRPSITRRHCSD